MNGNHAGALAQAHFDDLQADVEAGSRQINQIHQVATDIREALFRNNLEQADLMGRLVKQIGDLRECVRQQRVTMRDLRRDIRAMRDKIRGRS